MDISTVSDLHDGDDGLGIRDLIENPKVSLSEPVPVLSRELLAPRHTRIIGKTPDLSDDAASVPGLESFYLFDRRGFDADLIICHGASDP